MGAPGWPAVGCDVLQVTGLPRAPVPSSSEGTMTATIPQKGEDCKQQVIVVGSFRSQLLFSRPPSSLLFWDRPGGDTKPWALTPTPL